MGYDGFLTGNSTNFSKISVFQNFSPRKMNVFANASIRDSSIPSPIAGMYVLLQDSDTVEFYDGDDWVEIETAGVAVEYVVIAGGGGGGGNGGGGGGAGGYVSSINVFADTDQFLVTVGAGGEGGILTANRPTNGVDSSFANIFARGGGAGGQANDQAGSNGGSGGGGARGATAPGSGVQTQGFAGGTAVSGGPSAGGGGAGSVGANASGFTVGSAGGSGVSSSITGTSVGRAGGGGGGGITASSGGSATDGGGAGGGGTGTPGETNTGGGGGGSNNATSPFTGGNGGSGVVILKYPDSVTLTIGVGLTSTTASAGGFKVTTFTQGTDTVTVGI